MSKFKWSKIFFAGKISFSFFFIFLMQVLVIPSARAQYFNAMFYKNHSHFKMVQVSNPYNGSTPVTSANLTFTTPPKIGNSIVVVFWAYASGTYNVTPTITDSNGNTYTKAVDNQITAGYYNSAIFYGQVNAAPTSITVLPGVSVQMEAVAIEYEGPLTLDLTATNTGSSTIATTSLTLSTPGPRLLVSVFNSTVSGSTTFSTSGPSNLQFSQGNGITYESGAVVDQVGIFTPISVSNSLNGLLSGTWHGVMAAFK